MKKALAMMCLAVFLVACGGHDDKKTDPAAQSSPAPEQMKPDSATPAPTTAPEQPEAPAAEQSPSQDSGN